MQQPNYFQQPIVQQQYPQTENEKRVGSKINKTFIITVLFLLLSNSYKLIDNIYYMFTQKQFDMFNYEQCHPTTKGYIVVAILFFIIVFFL